MGFPRPEYRASSPATPGGGEARPRQIGVGEPEAAKFIADSGYPRRPGEGVARAKTQGLRAPLPPGKGDGGGGVTSIAKSQ